MKFATAITFLSVLICSTIAEPVAVAPRADNSAESVLEHFGLTSVTTGKTATKLASALQSAQSSLATRKDVTSAASVMATALPGSLLTSFTQNGIPHIDTTAPPSWFTGLPKDVRSDLVSQQSVLDKVVTSVLKIKSTGTSTSTGGAAQQTAGLVAGGAAVAGIVGVLAML